MSSARALAAAAWIAGSACVPAPAVIDTPPPGSAKTAVYVMEVDGEAPLVAVVDLRKTDAVPELAAHGKSMTLHALHFNCPVEVLGLEAGVQSALPDSDKMGHPLPPPAEAMSSSFDGKTQSAWTASEDVPAVRVAREIKCARYRLERTVIPETHATTSSTAFTFPSFGVATGEMEVIVAINDGRFFRVSPDGASQLALPPGTPYFAHYRAPDGTRWLYGPRGALASGDFDRGFTMAATATAATGETGAWIDGPHHEGDPFELFALDDSGLFQRFDGSAWQSIYRFRPRGPQAGEMFFGGVAVPRSGEGLAISEWQEQLVRAKNGTWHAENVIPGSTGIPSLYALTQIPHLGSVVGSFGGRLFVDAGDGIWQQLLDSPLQRGGGGFGIPAIIDIAPLDDGLLFGGGGGRFAQYQPELTTDSKYCNYRETMPVEGLMLPEQLAEFHTSAIVELSCGYALLSKQSAFSADVEITFLTRVP